MGLSEEHGFVQMQLGDGTVFHDPIPGSVLGSKHSSIAIALLVRSVGRGRKIPYLQQSPPAVLIHAGYCIWQ